MSNSVQRDEDIIFLVNQVKQLRKEKSDLLYQLSACQEQASLPSVEQFSLSELSRIAAGIVHDIQNGLGVIRNTLGFLRDELSDNSHEADLNKITHSLDFCELVMRNLSSLGGRDIFQPEWVNLESVVREVYSMLERKLIDVELVMDSDHEVPRILADLGQMKQVFMNLIKNAGEAMPDGGILTFRTRRENGMVRIDLEDTGGGISPENQQRLFRELFTTKSNGYGLGLYIVHTIIKRHGGTLEVKSKLGEGTTFIMYMPIESQE